MGKLNSVIDTLLSVRGNMGDSPNGSMGGSDSGRRNKRKARVPQQLTNVDGLANEIEVISLFCEMKITFVIP